MNKFSCLVALDHLYKYWQMPSHYKKKLAEQFPEVSFHFVYHPLEIIEKISSANIFYSWSITEHQLLKAKNLQWIQLASSGLDKRIPENFPLISKAELTNMKGVAANAVAEFVLGIIISINRGLFSAVLQSHQGIWNRQHFLDNNYFNRSLSKTCVGILGFGSIGLTLARLLKKLDVNVTVCSRQKPRQKNCFNKFYSLNEYEYFAAEIDFLVLALPLNNETKSMLRYQELNLLKEGAYIINVAREAIIDRESILRLITEKKIRGLLIDVLEYEPPAPETLYPTNEVIVTPHIAALYEDYWQEAMKVFTYNLNAHINKLNKINIVYTA